MGLWFKALAYGLGMVAVAVSAFIVYNAFFGQAPVGAAQVAEKRVCPPVVALPARGVDAPVDDLAGVGLRPGFTIAEANEWLLCRDEHFQFDYEQIWHTPVPATLHSRQRLLATRQSERIALGLVGQPDHEIAYALFQDIHYGETDATLTPDAVIARLTQHYGAAHDRKDGGTRIDLWWMYGPDDKPLKPDAPDANPFTAFTGWVSGSLALGGCEGKVKIDPLQQASWTKTCGLSIHAQIDLRPEDHTRIARYRIVVMDQARLAAAVEAYRKTIGAAAPPT